MDIWHFNYYSKQQTANSKQQTAESIKNSSSEATNCLACRSAANGKKTRSQMGAKHLKMGLGAIEEVPASSLAVALAPAHIPQNGTEEKTTNNLTSRVRKKLLQIVAVGPGTREMAAGMSGPS